MVERSNSVNADSKKTQRARILAILLNAKGAWVPLSQILDLQISQFGSRILELRRSGFMIENEQETVGGQRHSRYRLLLGAGVRAEPKYSCSNVGIMPPPQQSLFPGFCWGEAPAPERHRDDG
jgi:Helix-turn-helix domain